MPSLNPLERAIDELDAPEDFQGYREPSNPTIFINPGSSIENPTFPAFDPHGSLNSETPIAQELLLSPDTAPADVASTTDLDFNPGRGGCTRGSNCEMSP